MDDQGKHDEGELTLAPANVISRKRPKALWGVLAAVAVAAGALAVTSGDGDDEASPLLPIALGGAAGERGAPASAADSMLAWITYVPGDDLPALGGEAPAYRLSGLVDEAQVRALADALGLDGDVDQQDGSWTVTGADGATLQVSEGAGATWWYSATSPDTAVGRPAIGGAVDGCVEMEVEGGAVAGCSDNPIEPDCVSPDDFAARCPTVTTLAPMPPEECQPDATTLCVSPTPVPVDCPEVEAGDCPGFVEPPADLPSEDEARAIAIDLLAATGLDTDGAVITVDGPYDAWYVTVEPAVDGTPSGLLANVSVGSAGTVTSAGGYLGTPERLGDYPLLDTSAAIDRLNDDGGWFSYAPGAARDVAVASDEDPRAGCLDPSDATTTLPCPDDTGDTTTTVVPTTVPPCKVQADGSEICEGSGSSGAPSPELPKCPDLVPPADEPLHPDDVVECPSVDPIPVPMPELEPVPTEVLLTGATPILVLVPASDGSADAYLVPGYRFTGEEGVQVDAPAVADAALASSPTTEPPVDPPTTGTSLVPDPGGTDGGSTPPSGCEPLVEEDAAGTTHTIQPCAGVDPTALPEGEAPAIGVAYYADLAVFAHCSYVTVEVSGETWWADGIPGIESWSTPTEGGTLTFGDEEHAAFVGDAGGTKVAELTPYGPGPGPGCA